MTTREGSTFTIRLPVATDAESEEWIELGNEN
jgi:hypothetical protein